VLGAQKINALMAYLRVLQGGAKLFLLWETRNAANCFSLERRVARTVI